MIGVSGLTHAQRLALGVLVLLIVDIIWVASSELTEVSWGCEDELCFCAKWKMWNDEYDHDHQSFIWMKVKQLKEVLSSTVSGRIHDPNNKNNIYHFSIWEFYYLMYCLNFVILCTVSLLDSKLKWDSFSQDRRKLLLFDFDSWN